MMNNLKDDVTRTRDFAFKRLPRRRLTVASLSGRQQCHLLRHTAQPAQLGRSAVSHSRSMRVNFRRSNLNDHSSHRLDATRSLVCSRLSSSEQSPGHLNFEQSRDFILQQPVSSC